MSNKFFTDETTRFVLVRVCESCGNDGWGTYSDQKRCHACGRIVANLDGAGGYLDDDEADT